MSEPRISSYIERQPTRPGQVSFGVRRMSGEIIWMSCDHDCYLYEIIIYLIQFHLQNELISRWQISNAVLIIGLEEGPLAGDLCLLDVIEKLRNHDFMFHLLVNI